MFNTTLPQSPLTVNQITARFAVEYPALNGRIERGAAIVEAGHITPQADGSYIVSRHDGSSAWRVRFDLNWRCDCPDAAYNQAPMPFAGGVQPTCKHVIAAAIVWLMGDQAPAPAPKSQPISQAEFDQAAARKYADKSERRASRLNQTAAAVLARDKAKNERGAKATAAALRNGQAGFEPPFATAGGRYDWRTR